jgi:Activator of Hsp90 ATPase homolog 1-like protein
MAEPLAPILRTFDVRCSGEHAFDTWTRRITLWWPLANHSVSRENAASVSVEPWSGGRIPERTRSGEEILWGTVETWEPPRLFAYLWFIKEKDASQATRVTITFTPLGPARTRVGIEQTGWERAGAMAEARRRGNEWGWDGLQKAFTRFINAEWEGR